MNAYFKVISLVERLHRQFLELVKLELEGLGIHDINNVQGMMLFSIGDAEMTVGERDIQQLEVGQHGFLATLALPDEKHPFTIERVVMLPEPKDGENAFKVQEKFIVDFPYGVDSTFVCD